MRYLQVYLLETYQIVVLFLVQRKGICVCFAASLYRDRGHPQQRGCSLPSPFPGTTLGVSASSTKALNSACDHLCFIAMHFVHQLARQVLRYSKILIEIYFVACFGNAQTFFHINKGNCFFALHHFAYGKFPRKLYFQIAGETCI